MLYTSTHAHATLYMNTAQCIAHHWHIVVVDDLGNRLGSWGAPCTHYTNVLGLSAIPQFAKKLAQGCDPMTLIIDIG